MDDDLQAGEDGLYCVNFKNVYGLDKSLLSDLMSQYGRVVKVTGSEKPGMWCYVRYGNPEEAVRAMSGLRSNDEISDPHTVRYCHGRAVSSSDSSSKVAGRGGARGRGVGPAGARRFPSKSPLHRPSHDNGVDHRSPVRAPSDPGPKDQNALASMYEVFIGNWPVDLNERDVHALFDKYEIPVVDVRLYKKDDKSFAFVEVKNAEDTQRAITKLDGGKVAGRQIRVTNAKTRDKHQPEGGGHAGRGRAARGRGTGVPAVGRGAGRGARGGGGPGRGVSSTPRGGVSASRGGRGDQRRFRDVRDIPPLVLPGPERPRSLHRNGADFNGRPPPRSNSHDGEFRRPMSRGGSAPRLLRHERRPSSTTSSSSSRGMPPLVLPGPEPMAHGNADHFMRSSMPRSQLATRTFSQRSDMEADMDGPMVKRSRYESFNTTVRPMHDPPNMNFAGTAPKLERASPYPDWEPTSSFGRGDMLFEHKVESSAFAAMPQRRPTDVGMAMTPQQRMSNQGGADRFSGIVSQNRTMVAPPGARGREVFVPTPAGANGRQTPRMSEEMSNRAAEGISGRIKDRLHSPTEIVVANFPAGTTEINLLDMFKRFNPLNVRIMVNNSSRDPDDFTYAYLTLSSRIGADQAVIEMDGLLVQGRPLVVETKKC